MSSLYWQYVWRVSLCFLYTVALSVTRYSTMSFYFRYIKLLHNHQTSNDTQFWILGRKKERWEQTKYGWNEVLGGHQKYRHQEGSAHKTCGNFPWKLKIKVVWSLPEPRTQPHLCKIDKTGSFGEKEQRSTEKEAEGQHKGRFEKI